MLSPLTPDDFHRLLAAEPRLVLAAYLNHSLLFQDQKKLLVLMASEYLASLTTCVLDSEYFDTFNVLYGVGGAPTYLLFRNGQEVARLLGVVDRPVLEELVGRGLGIPGQDQLP